MPFETPFDLHRVVALLELFVFLGGIPVDALDVVAQLHHQRAERDELVVDLASRARRA